MTNKRTADDLRATKPVCVSDLDEDTHKRDNAVDAVASAVVRLKQVLIFPGLCYQRDIPPPTHTYLPPTPLMPY